MGCVSSSANLNKRFDELCHSPQFVKWNEMFEALQFQKQEIKQLYQHFSKADLDGGGTIDLTELLSIIELERTPFTERVFSIFDEDNSGKIDFGEFVLALWNFCTLTKTTLAIFSFELYDRDESGELEESDLEMMLKDVYGKEFKKNFYAKQILKELVDLNYSMDVIDVDAFLQFSLSHQYLLFPAFQMQTLLRKRFMGIPYWETHGQKRSKLSENKYVKLETYLTMITKKDFRGVDGWLAPKGTKSAAKEHRKTKGDCSTKSKASNELDELFGTDFSTPTAAIVPKRKSSKSLGQDRRASRDYSQQQQNGVATSFITPRQSGGSQLTTPRSDSGLQYATPRSAGSSGKGAQFVSPRVTNGAGGASTNANSTGSQFVSPRIGTLSNGGSNPRLLRGRSSFATPRDNSITPAISELEEFMTTFNEIPTANMRRKSVVAPAPFKAGIIVPDNDDVSIDSRASETKESDGKGKGKKRRGSM